nr:disease resistance protein rpp13 [Quercus suber]
MPLNLKAFVLRRMYARTMGFTKRYFFILKNLKADTDPCNEIEEIKNKINEHDKCGAQTLKESNQVEPLRIRQLTSHRSSYQDEGLTMNQLNNNSSYSVDEEPDIIGFRKYIKKLVAMLTDLDYQGHRGISVLGKHGPGKTTFATAIYRSREVRGHFDCRAWVLASGNLTDVLLSTLEQIVNATVDKKSTKEELVEKIRTNLQEKRYLVVLDDLQEPSVWKELLDTFPDTKNGSRVMLTTSNDRVAFSADTRVDLHPLNQLNRKDTWELFLKKVCLTDNLQLSDEEISKLKKKIISRCKGLPLAIVVLGGLLSTKEVSYEVWLKVLEHPSWQLDSKQVQFSNILALSYNDLAFHLRPCFLYFRLFPKDYDIPLRRLLRLWLAEGFVKQTPGMTPEE